jgi:pimeloyl-ACP methyl ester carboxylesterase
MEERVPLIFAPTLLIGATDDPFAYPHITLLSSHIRNCRRAVIEGGMIPLPDQKPEEFARHVILFLE